jgi:hypothetical protein
MKLFVVFSQGAANYPEVDHQCEIYDDWLGYMMEESLLLKGTAYQMQPIENDQRPGSKKAPALEAC